MDKDQYIEKFDEMISSAKRLEAQVAQLTQERDLWKHNYEQALDSLEWQAKSTVQLESKVAEIANERDVARQQAREARALILRGLEFSQTWEMRDRMCAWLKAQEGQGDA